MHLHPYSNVSMLNLAALHNCKEIIIGSQRAVKRIVLHAIQIDFISVHPCLI